MADTTLSLLLQLKDDASMKLDAFEGKLRDCGQQLEELSTQAVVAGGAITAALGLMVNAAENTNVSEERLAITIRNAGGNYDDLKDSIDGVIEAQVRTTSYSKDEQINALQKLVFVTGDYNKALQLLPTALDLAAMGNMDLTQAATMLGKVDDGVVAQLKRFGIVLSDQALAAAKAGDSSLAQAEIQQKVAGAAEATANPLKIMKNEMAEMGENIGSTVLPALKALVDIVVPIISAIGNFAEHHKLLTGIIVVGLGAFATMITVLGTIGLVLPNVILGLQLLRSAELAQMVKQIAMNAAMWACPLVWIIALIVVLGVVIYELVKHFDKVKAAFVFLWDLFKQGCEVFITIFKKAFDFIGDMFRNLWEGAKTAFKDFCNFFVGLAEGFANVWVKAINWVIDCIDKIHVSLPSWLGGGSFGFNISHIDEVALPRLAEGGIATTGGMAIVGERGPEIISMPTGASVTPLGGAGGGNVTVSVTVQGSMMGNAQELANVIRVELLKVSRRNVNVGLT